MVHIELGERRPFTSEDHTLLTVLAGRLGQGLQRVHQLDQQRETALALQHAILGPSVSSGFAVRYQPATRPLQVGGDWYDVVDLDDGRIALIVGDCVGHGLAAATVMGQLRSACRALLLEHPSPSAALVGTRPVRGPAARRTVHHSVLRGARARKPVRWCTPAQVIRRRSWCWPTAPAAARRRRATPLGLAYDRTRPEARVTMPPRATLLLYTDGLVERRREALDDGIAPRRRSRSGQPATPRSTAWPTRSCRGWRPATAIRTTSRCCSTASPHRWRSSSPPTPASSRPPAPRCAAG